MTATTTQPTSPPQKGAALIREFFGALPQGSRYYLAAIDLDRRSAQEKRLAVLKELRGAFRDPSVGSITVLFLYDDAEGVAQ